MRDFLVWWLGIEAVGLAAFPLTFVFLGRLPDRGFAFSKVMGLLLLAYGLWMGSILGLFPNSRSSVILLLLLLAGLSGVLAVRRRRELARFVRSGWGYIVLVEAIFFAVLASAVFIRSFAPEIVWGEKPFELAFLNSINRSESFPPRDPWLAGHSISYYYFGYVMIAVLTKLTALGTNVTFYFGLSLMAALAAITGFGVVYNMIAASRRRADGTGGEGPALITRGVLFGLGAAALMLIVSNLEGVFELMARHGVGSRGFYGLVGISGLSGPYDCSAAPGDCSAWYPTRYWWWWWATRMGSKFDIQEFPFFSFQFGDLHPHVLAMPLLITVLAVALHIVLGARGAGSARERGRSENLDALWAIRHPGRHLLLALLLGGVAFTDTWTIPMTALMVLAAAVIANWLRTAGSLWRMLLDSAGFILPVVGMAFLLYLPFYLNFHAEASGIAINETARAVGRVPPASESTRPLHFLLFWSPLLWVALSFVAVYVYRRRREILKPSLLALSALPWAGPIGLWLIIVLARGGFSRLADELRERGPSLLTVAMLIASITVVALSFFDQLRKPSHEQDRGQLFAFLLAGFALVMLLGAEFYFVKDALGWRGNTVFRFWHESWIILAIVGGFGLYRLTLGWRLPRLRPEEVPWRRLADMGVVFGAAYTLVVAIDPWNVLYARWWTATYGIFVAGGSIVVYAAATAVRPASGAQVWRRLAWLSVTTVILAAALVYPVTVIFERTDGFRHAQSVNGLVDVQRDEPEEYAAIQWLNRNVEGTPVILEGFGDDFSDYARISSRTGLPTVIGWLGHEIQWRGHPSGSSPFTDRPDEVEEIYTTSDVAAAQSLLRKYDVEYVYIGRLEREKYSDEGLAKFGEFMTPVFEDGDVTIYQMPAQTATAARAPG
jgi:YYY domain-containing protein